jgi:pimeloyl-ACP methyl ester carboxylesterase
MMGRAKAHYDGIVAFSQTDFTEDLKKISVPVLVMHGDDAQIVPYAHSGAAVRGAPTKRDSMCSSTTWERFGSEWTVFWHQRR